MLTLALAMTAATFVPALDGSLAVSQVGTIARYQRAIGQDAEFAILKAQAEANARLREPNTIDVLQVIVREIDATATNEKGETITARSRFTEEEIARCRANFRHYQDLVFVYSGGALRVRGESWVLRSRVRKMDPMGENRYWLSTPTALEAIADRIPEGKYDSICVYYKRPEGVTMGLLGGAVGRDYGFRGSSYWTQWAIGLDKPDSVFNIDAVVSLHEWLHNVTYTAHKIDNTPEFPDVHAGEEYGYSFNQGGYADWMAWYRDLMLFVAPREMWYRFDGNKPEVSAKALPPDRPSAGRLFAWGEVWEDPMRRLPKLDLHDLARLIGMPGLKLEAASAPDAPTIVRLAAPHSERPLFSGELKEAPVALDNVLRLSREMSQVKVEDPLGGYGQAGTEAMLVVQPRPGPSLVLIRKDVAGPILGRLGASERVVGFVTLPSPSEGHPVNLIAAWVQLGPGQTEAELIGNR